MYLGWKTRYLNKNAYKDALLLMCIYARIAEENKELLRGKKSIFENNSVISKLKDSCE